MPVSYTHLDFDLHKLGSGADEYELVVDAELPAGIFTPEAPEGERFEYFEHHRRLTLGEMCIRDSL